MSATLEQIREASSRFWSKVEKTANCWMWRGSRDSHGYGQIRIGGRRVTSPMGAHRVAYMLAFGEIPSGLNVCHKCDNPTCVNPSHLFLGSQSDNLLDCYAKQRHPRAGGKALGERNYHAKLDEGKVRWIRQVYQSSELTPTQIARILNVHVQTIWHVIYRETWGNVE